MSIKDKIAAKTAALVDKAKKSDKIIKNAQRKAQSIYITNDNISEHRAEILAQGKKFKYPVQVSRKKLIVRALIILLVAVAIFGSVVGWQLYRSQSLDDLYYSVTRVMPLPVARVDGYNVRYDSYLRRIRSDVHYYRYQERRDFNSNEGRNELNYYKRIELKSVEREAYAAKLAKEKNITVTDDDANKFIEQHLKAEKSSNEELLATLKDYYGWTRDEYAMVVKGQLLEKKVAYQIDTAAKQKLQKVQAALKNEDFVTVAAKYSDDEDKAEATPTAVSVNNTNDPTDVLSAVKQVKDGEITKPIQVKLENGDYYYYIAKRIGITNSDEGEQMNYLLITIKLKQFTSDFNKLQKDGKIKEYINIPSEQATKKNNK